jgi:hypothetical protein
MLPFTTRWIKKYIISVSNYCAWSLHVHTQQSSLYFSACFSSYYIGRWCRVL